MIFCRVPVGNLIGVLPGTWPTIATFIAYAFERTISKSPERFGSGTLEGVAAPEAASHSKTQVDFIPTMTLGILGDVVMALILGALLIQGIQPGSQSIGEHANLFWGLIASFWIGNVLLLLNVPLIGLWVKLLRVLTCIRRRCSSSRFAIIVSITACSRSGT